MRSPPAGDLLAQVFAEDATTGNKFKVLRQILNKFSHVDPTGLYILVGSDESSPEIDARRAVRNVRVYIGGRFGQPTFQDTARLLLPIHGSIPSAMARGKAGADAEWESDVERWVQRVADIVDAYDLMRVQGSQHFGLAVD